MHGRTGENRKWLKGFWRGVPRVFEDQGEACPREQAGSLVETVPQASAWLDHPSRGPSSSGGDQVIVHAW